MNNRNTSSVAKPVAQTAGTPAPAQSPVVSTPKPVFVSSPAPETAPSYAKPEPKEPASGGIKIPDFLQKNKK